MSKYTLYGGDEIGVAIGITILGFIVLYGVICLIASIVCAIKYSIKASKLR